MRNWRALYGVFAILCVLAASCFISSCSSLDGRTHRRPPAKGLPPGRSGWWSPDFDTLVKNAVGHLDTGSVTFNPPAEMRVGQSQDMEVIISRIVHDKIAEALRGGRTSTTMEVRIAPEMSAELRAASSDEFSIKPLSSQDPVQTFGPDGKARWIWHIEPLKAGHDEEISLVIRAIVFVPGQKLPVDAITQVVTITVDAKPWSEAMLDFVHDNWQWLWTALLVPFVPWAWKKLQKGYRRPARHRSLSPRRKASIPVVKGEAEIRTAASVAASDLETPHAAKEK
jgi:hypothetical protein